MVLVSSASSRCALIGQLLVWPRPHSRSHTALRVKGASGERRAGTATRLRSGSSHTHTHTDRGRQVEQLWHGDRAGKEQEKEGEKAGQTKRRLWSLYGVDIKTKNVLSWLSRWHDEQVTLNTELELGDSDGVEAENCHYTFLVTVSISLGYFPFICAPPGKQCNINVNINETM